jgi:LmbE family N-acetylglucosaminyl deacetylase
MSQLYTKNVAVVVAHPDDETLWAGGTILSHPAWNCFIVCLCRGNDVDRASKFQNALKALNARGVMGELDDGPEQAPLSEEEVEELILNLLPLYDYDLLITHSHKGEYTRHLRHEETGKAVAKLWKNGKISASELWSFAYSDNNGKHYPHPIKSTTYFHVLTKHIWQRKYKIITETYGFEKNSWEAETTPKAEAFMQFSNKYKAR